MLRTLFFVAALAGLAHAQTVAPIGPVEEESLALDAFSTGLLSRGDGGLGPEMWNGAARDSLLALLGAAPVRPASPALGEALRRVLLSRGRGPSDPSGALGAAKLTALVRAGFVDEARQIEALAANAPANLGAMALADLAAGDRDSACGRNARMPSAREERIFIKLRLLCYVAANNLDAAELAFGVLRERGALAADDLAIFSPLIAGARAGGPLPARDIVQRAALAHMNTPLSPDFAQSDAGVAASVMRDTSAAWPLRLAALRAAVAAGVAGPQEARALAAAPPLTPAQISGATDPDLRDAALYQSIAALSAPEFAAERAQKIAGVFTSADARDAVLLAAALYGDEIESIDTSQLSPSQAVGLARAAIAAGRGEIAARALAAAHAGGAQGGADQAAFARTLSALYLLDERAASGLSDQTGAPIALLVDGLREGSSASLAPVAGAAIAAAANGARGQSALAALAASGPMRNGDAVAAEIFRASFLAAGLGDLAARHRAVEALFPMPAAPPPVTAPAAAPPAAKGQARGLTPRLKPAPTR